MKSFFKKYLSRILAWTAYSRRDSIVESQSADLDPGIVEVDVEVLGGQTELLKGRNNERLLPHPDKIGEEKESEVQTKPSDKAVNSEQEISADTEFLSWDQAAHKLRESGRPGKVVVCGSGYQVKYHDEWREHDRKKKIAKKLQLERLLQEEEAARRKEEKKKRARLELIAQKKAEAEAKEAEKRRLYEEKQKLRLQELAASRAENEQKRQQEIHLQQENESQNKIFAEQQRRIFEEKTRERLLRSVAQKVGRNKKIVAQYRHPGSAIERMSELGIWILEENGYYFRFHESKGRFQYAGKSREVTMDSKEEAIEYCRWLVRRGWYRDIRLHGISQDNAGFPVTKLPTSAERIKARREFITWRERMAQMTQQFTERSQDMPSPSADIDDILF